jgi:cytochrome c556
MTSLTLFEIAQEYRHITDVLMDSGVDEQTLTDTLEGEAWPLELKAQNYAFVVRNLEATAAAIKEAEAAMKKRRESLDKRSAYLKERLKTGMEIAGVSKLECPHFAITIKKNPPAVDIWDEKQIPVQFMRTPEPPPPPVATPDKAAISAAIKAGEDVPGAKQVQGTRLEIK